MPLIGCAYEVARSEMTNDRIEEERPQAEDGVAEETSREEAHPGNGVGDEPSADAAVGGEELNREAQLESELAETRDRLLRLAAEFDNYRKRTERERAEQTGRAQGKLVLGLLDAIDDLERVADFTAETTTVEALLEGVQMVERKLLRALEMSGLEKIEARGGTFDPEVHEALMTAPTDNPEEDDTVGEIFQNGYRFQGQLLRPARVQVRKHG